ncbi:hypothetical protein ARSEF4850_008196 [Beauveria asiatica]
MTNISRTAGGRVEKRRRARPWSRWKLSSVGRVFGAFMSQNNSNREFERVRQHAVHRENFFRLDFEHDGPQPALDDVTDLKGRQSWAEETAARSPNIDALALCIRAQHFYFELDDEPVYANHKYRCSGRILCDFESGSPEQMLLLDGLGRREASFRLDGQSLSGEFLGRDARGHDSVVVKNVTFSVDTKRTKFSIEVCEGENRSYGISGYGATGHEKAGASTTVPTTQDKSQNVAVEPSPKLRISTGLDYDQCGAVITAWVDALWLMGEPPAREDTVIR